MRSIPRSGIEVAAIGGVGPITYVFTIVLPLSSPRSLSPVTIVQTFFDTSGLVHAITRGIQRERPPSSSIESGSIGLDLDSSAAQNVVLTPIVGALTSHPVPLARTYGALRLRRSIVAPFTFGVHATLIKTLTLIAFSMWIVLLPSSQRSEDVLTEPIPVLVAINLPKTISPCSAWL